MRQFPYEINLRDYRFLVQAAKNFGEFHLTLIILPSLHSAIRILSRLLTT